MPTAVIADDEDLPRGDLRRMLAQAWPELAIVAECEDGGEALAAIAAHRPDVAFLDIRMPELSGLDVARASEGRCRVVFTTAYDAHAIEAFGLGALDYLLKPITPERLEQSVARLRSQLAAGLAMPDLMRMMADFDRQLSASRQAERIKWISTTAGNNIKLFPIDEVLFFDADSRYTRVVSATDEGVVRTTIRDLQKGLDPDQFWQVHRGTLVNARAIAGAQRDEMGNLHVLLRGHAERLKVSQSYLWRFRHEVQ
ncbi:LytTR family transcriptional regulator DNA-binding domain-containing protein [Massilia sp. SR12]